MRGREGHEKQPHKLKGGLTARHHALKAAPRVKSAITYPPDPYRGITDCGGTFAAGTYKAGFAPCGNGMRRVGVGA